MKMPAMKRELSTSYDEVLSQLPEALKAEGFGVLTEIDVKQTLKKKIDVDFRRYIILGACNPALAHRALENDLDVGVLLPCNVSVWELDGGGTMVCAMDPDQAIGAFGDDTLRDVASEARARLGRAIEQLK